MENKNSDMKVNSNINENKVSLILNLRKNGINNPICLNKNIKGYLK